MGDCWDFDFMDVADFDYDTDEPFYCSRSRNDGLEPECIGRFKCLGETERAISVASNGKIFNSKWIPKSVLHVTSQVKRPGDEGELIVARWFAEREPYTAASVAGKSLFKKKGAR